MRLAFPTSSAASVELRGHEILDQGVEGGALFGDRNGQLPIHLRGQVDAQAAGADRPMERFQHTGVLRDRHRAQ